MSKGKGAAPEPPVQREEPNVEPQKKRLRREVGPLRVAERAMTPNEQMLARGPRRPAYHSFDYVAQRPAPFRAKEAQWEDEDGRLYRIDQDLGGGVFKASCKLPGKRSAADAVQRPQINDSLTLIGRGSDEGRRSGVFVEAQFFVRPNQALGYVHVKQAF